VTRLTATKGSGAPHSIGAGVDGQCGTVTIGGHKGAISTSPFTYPFPFSGDLSWLARDYEAKNGDVLTGKLGSKVRITVPDGATVTLDGVTINGENDPNCPWSGISCTGNATIVLKGRNTVRGFAKNYPGIYIATGKTLTIRGDGSLNATSNDYAAGIGGGYELACGNIVVESGTITATGTSYAAGIGSGYNASCGTVTIKGGTVSTTGGSSSAGIGSAYQGSCGNVVIEGGTVNTKGGSHAAGIGSGQKGSCGNITITKGITHVTATAGSQCPISVGAGVGGSCGTVTIGGIVGAVNQTVYDSSVGVIVTGVSLSQTLATLEAGETLKLTATIAPANATNKGVTWSSSNTAVATVAGGVVTAKAAGKATITATTDDGGKKATCTVTVYDDSDEFIVDLSLLTEDYTAYDGDILTGTLGKNVKISIASGATVTLRDATINGVNNGAYRWAGINCRGNATIVLEGSNSVRGFQGDYPGIHIAKDKTLTIKGSGTLNASAYGSGWGGAGIGGGSHIDCGNIVIEGGTVNAGGNNSAPGIGSGSNASCGNITITSGVTSVTAHKGGNGAPYSIGPSKSGSCGTVTIGGKVTGPISQSPYTYKP